MLNYTAKPRLVTKLAQNIAFISIGNLDDATILINQSIPISSIKNIRTTSVTKNDNQRPVKSCMTQRIVPTDINTSCHINPRM